MEARTVATVAPPALVITNQSIVTEEFRLRREREIDIVWSFLEGKICFYKLKFLHEARNNNPCLFFIKGVRFLSLDGGGCGWWLSQVVG